MSYLSRFGYKKEDGLDIFVVANDEAGEILKNSVDIDADMRVLDVTQAAKFVGANIGQQSDGRYTDSLYASYLGKRSKFLLPMNAELIDEYVKPRKVASFLVAGLLFASAYLGYNAFQNWKNALELSDEIILTKQQIKTQKHEYDRELAKTKGMGFDFLVVDSALKNYNELNEKKVTVLPVLKEVGRSLGTDLTLDKIEVYSKSPKRTSNQFSYQSSQDQNEDSMSAVLFLSFPDDIVPEVGVTQINSLRDRLVSNLPDYDIEIIKQVADLSYTGNVVGGSDSEKTEPDDFKAEIEIRERKS